MNGDLIFTNMLKLMDTVVGCIYYSEEKTLLVARSALLFVTLEEN